MVNVLNSWRHVSLSELVSFHKGGTLSKMDLAESGIPCVLYGELYTRYGEVTNRIHSRCSAVLHELTLSKEEDVLLPSSGETPEEMAKATCVTIADVGIGGDIIIARPKPGASGRFISYQLNHTLVNQVASIAQGNAIVHLNAGRLASIQTVAPGEAEQRTIAEVLSGFDEHLANLDELITKKKAIRDGALEELVSKDTHRQHESTATSWTSTLIGDFAEIKRGASPRPIDSYLTESPDGINWIKIGDAPKGGTYISQTGERITHEGAASSVQVNPGDLILSNSMSFGRPYILQTSGCIHDGWLSLQNFSNHADALYLLYLLSSKSVKLQYSAFAAGSGVKNLKKEVVRKVRVDLPPLVEQREIAEVLSGMDEEIRLLAEERAKVERLKLGAMDDLLTGRVRLPLEEEAA